MNTRELALEVHPMGWISRAKLLAITGLSGRQLTAKLDRGEIPAPERHEAATGAWWRGESLAAHWNERRDRLLNMRMARLGMLEPDDGKDSRTEEPTETRARPRKRKDRAPTTPAPGAAAGTGPDDGAGQA